MGKGTYGAAAFALAAPMICTLTACSGGGGGGGGGGPLPLGTALTVISHQPLDGTTQVSLEAMLEVSFDGILVPDCLRQPGTGLFESDGSRVTGSTVTQGDGSVLRFVPENPLRAQETYTFRLSPLTCDVQGRLVDRLFAFTFDTLDQQPPAVASASVNAGQTGVSTTATLTVDLDEALTPGSVSASAVRLRDSLGNPVATTTTLSGPARVQVDPVPDLAGASTYTLELRTGSNGITDRVGNPLASAWSVGFSTAPDVTVPLLQASWPVTGTSNASPAILPTLRFSESLDPASVTATALQMVDGGAAAVPFTTRLSADQRTLRLVPQSALITGTSYTVTVAAGAGALADLSGNTLSSGNTFSFTAGSDATPPTVVGSDPAAAASSVALQVEPTVTFSEPMDPASLVSGVVTLIANGVELPVTAFFEAGNTVLRIRPVQALTAAEPHGLTVRGGTDGARDLAGNPLIADFTVVFQTTPDASTPTVLLAPYDGHSAVPRLATMSAVFDAPMEPSTLNATTVVVLDYLGNPISGTVEVSRGDRVARFRPSAPLQPGFLYTTTIIGGPGGAQAASGNWLPSTATAQFRAVAARDSIAPTVSITINNVETRRKEGVTVPPSGFDLDVDAFDPVHYTLDMATVEIAITGTGSAPGADAIFSAAQMDGSQLHYSLPSTWALAPGSYEVRALIRDLSGNVGTSPPLTFRVEDPDTGVVPFERTQVVWVRFDLDRDNNGRDDLEDDLLRLGLMTPGDPAGTNEFMKAAMREAVLVQAHTLFGRGADGNPLGPDSVALRLTPEQPLGLLHAQIACAGFDPEGDATRTYGDRSTGTLGRAWFDYRNSSLGDTNTGTNPGLGVFPAELFLFESRIHKQVYPSFQTSFARAFLLLAPDLGGTPAGSHFADAVVLHPNFDYASGSSTQQARFNIVFTAVDEWATAIGTILAHEIGHSVGLVASGANPGGLHGDGSLHNEFSSGTDVMASALGYDSLVYLNYRFRDLNTAYLRQRLLMK